ncbi:MAG: transferase hexapeptide repeat family protein [Saprospiraceae bacterium]|jgi:phenylacetic acid degradation protein|nr:transferase hexapeptide repeat family protein [Saprospiraceae bacterium]MBP9210403.1 transferase hexapeptide repeat family protein [Saprospiraceae bacterium]MBV6472428.1 Carnitine operon protein CaiE [Saprospiraceae bacterium]
MIYAYKNHIPVVHPSAYIHPQAAVTGCVVIGKDVYIAPFAAIRGDFGMIVIEDGCNVQESCTVHMFPGIEVRLCENAHIGHGAIIHGARIGRNCLVGMHSVIMDQVELGEDCIVGAMSFIREGTIVPPRSLVVGNPARIVREVDDRMLEWKSRGTEIYQQLARDAAKDIRPCEPLREMPPDYPLAGGDYLNWAQFKKQDLN